MTTLHRWFSSGNYALLGHADLPETRGPVGVVIVPPFGWEDACSYRPLRFLARTLAEYGIPVLRFDLPGTGDSSGGLTDAGLFDAWIRAIAAAAGELRALSGVEQVAIFGIRLGGLLATVAASRAVVFEDLILWGAPVSGRSELRELRAYANMERWEFASGAPTQPGASFDAGGFPITAAMQRDLEAIDLESLPIGRRRVLILSRDGVSAGGKLVRAFESCGCPVHVVTGGGYSSMMKLPHESLPPGQTARAVVEFLAAAIPREHIRHRNEAGFGGIEIGADAVETICLIRTPAGSNFGVLSEPARNAPAADCCVLFLNAGGVRHIGPNRMWVEAARRQAAKGIASLRLDLASIGESDGAPNLDVPEMYRENLVEQVERAMDFLRSRVGARRFIAIGLCSGAFWSYHAALRNPEICAAVLLNPSLFFWDPAVDRRRLLRRGGTGLITPAYWWRALHGRFRIGHAARAARDALAELRTSLAAFSRPQIPAEKMAEAWKIVEGHGTRVTLVFSENEPLYREMEEERQLPPAGNSRLRIVRIGKAGHTLRPRWAQNLVHDLIDAEIGAALEENRVDDYRSTKASTGGQAHTRLRSP
ncbi:MAG: alpha/beta fold hydrolase [Bryobacteraceae bacterium]